jgi:hypothetical protein
MTTDPWTLFLIASMMAYLVMMIWKAIARGFNSGGIVLETKTPNYIPAVLSPGVIEITTNTASYELSLAIFNNRILTVEKFTMQLIEVIPNATAIAAKAYNVTIEEFNQMLVSGKIVTIEFVPLFIRQLEKDT